jgi:hypothetical protein
VTDVGGWPGVFIALIGSLGLVTAAWISRPSARRLRRIEGQFTPNGGSSVKDALNRIEGRQERQSEDIAHLTGRFDQHMGDIQAAHAEGTQMWRAVESVAKSTPPEVPHE